jgi:hypothetical protein
MGPRAKASGVDGAPHASGAEAPHASAPGAEREAGAGKVVELGPGANQQLHPPALDVEAAVWAASEALLYACSRGSSAPAMGLLDSIERWCLGSSGGEPGAPPAAPAAGESVGAAAVQPPPPPPALDADGGEGPERMAAVVAPAVPPPAGPQPELLRLALGMQDGSGGTALLHAAQHRGMGPAISRIAQLLIEVASAEEAVAAVGAAVAAAAADAAAARSAAEQEAGAGADPAAEGRAAAQRAAAGQDVAQATAAFRSALARAHACACVWCLFVFEGLYIL